VRGANPESATLITGATVQVTGNAVVALRNVSFTYRDSDRPALREVNVEVARGEFVVVMGPTGAGKSTLAKCLSRIVPGFHPGKLEGDVIIEGKRLEHEGVAHLAGVVGFVSQDFEAQLFATNAAQEIVFGMEQLGVAVGEMPDRLAVALHTVGLEGFERRDPASLSGGEKQRLAIAAVLALQPRIFVFDEPTTDLDPQGKLQFFDVLAAMRREGSTIVLVEHEIGAAERADRLVLMDNGCIVANDRPERLLPDVDLLNRLGVRPADLDRVAHALGRSARFGSVQDAAAFLRARVRSVPSTPPVAEKGDTLLEAIAVSHDYGRANWGLRDVSFRLRAGEFVAVIGQNGSGKSTLAKHLNGLLCPCKGRVLLRGRDLAGLSLVEVAAEVGYVFQDPDHQIFASTVREEVGFGPKNAGVQGVELDRRIKRAIDAVGLRGFEEEDPFLLGKGHRQQLAVASLLAVRPRVLILDEPTTGLDYPEQRRMMELLGRLHADGLTLVMITHSPWVVAEYAERGVLMQKGRIVFDGPLRELFTQEEMLERCHFRIPDVTRIGLRCGFTPLVLKELLDGAGVR
jgi:energy-coupling factor transport system ATP-binding protein